MSAENPSHDPTQEAPKPEENKLEQPPQAVKSEPRRLTPEEEKAEYEKWLEKNPEVPKVLIECGPEIAKFQELVASFEATFSLAELHLITDLTPKDAPSHPLRGPAHEALAPIRIQRGKLKEDTNITPEEFAELDKEYKRISRAIGIINNGKVDHTR